MTIRANGRETPEPGTAGKADEPAHLALLVTNSSRPTSTNSFPKADSTAGIQEGWIHKGGQISKGLHPKLWFWCKATGICSFLWSILIIKTLR